MDLSNIIFILLSLLVSVNCIMWNLEPNSRKCLREELQQNIPVIGEFEVSEAPGQSVDYLVSMWLIINLQTVLKFI